MCTRPLPARRVNGQIEFLGRTPSGRFVSNALATLQIPCGQCVECRLKRSREWAIRCLHEASLHRDNCFVTLTYKDAPVSLDYGHYQAFMKRLRARFPRDTIRFYACGEYGETNPRTGLKDGGLYRPHFHACLFGFNFPDRKPVRLLGQSDLFSSEVLNATWGHGHCTIGNVTFESAAYVARYIMGKVTGDLAKAHYMLITEDGEMIERVPEMCKMSLRPGIGHDWFRRFSSDVFPRDEVIARGKATQPPRYYDKLLSRLDEAMAEAVAAAREREGRTRAADHTDKRNAVRDVVIKAGIRSLIRD